MPDEMLKELGTAYNPLYQEGRPHGEPRDPDEATAWMAIDKAMAAMPTPPGGGSPGGGAPGSIETMGLPLTPEQLAERERLRTRLSPFKEIILTSEIPQDIRIATRLYWGVLEEKPAVFTPWVANQDWSEVLLRLRKLKPYFDIPEESAKRMGLGKGPEDESPLTKEVESSAKEFEARKTILELCVLKNRTAGSSEQYMDTLFKYGERPKVDAMYFKIVGNLEATVEGKEKFGVLLDRAMREWLNIAEGKVPQELGLRNPWGESTYQSDTEKIYRYLTEKCDGDVTAVRLAERLIRLFDMHIEYAVAGTVIERGSFTAKWLRQIGKVPTPQEYEQEARRKGLIYQREKGDGTIEEIIPEGGEFLLPQYLEMAIRRGEVINEFSKPYELALESSDTTADKAKPRFWAVRQLGEHDKYNPRSSSPTPGLGVFPNFVGDMFNSVTVRNPKGDYISLKKLWREDGVLFGDLPWDEREWKKLITTVDGRMLDMKVIKGIQKSAEHVPWGLQQLYASFVYEFVSSTDLEKMGGPEGIMSDRFLWKTNKAFELGFAILFGGTDLPKETKIKIMQVAKVNALAQFINENTKGADDKDITDLAKKGKAPLEIKNRNINKVYYVGLVIDAARESGFFSRGDHLLGRKLSNGKTLYDMEVALLKKLVDRRQGIKPSGLMGDFAGLEGGEFTWFSEAEIKAINKAGVYFPLRA